MREDFFNRRDAHALALGTACDTIFGPEWLTWEIRTIRDELRMLGHDMDELNSQKLAAYKVSKTTIGPWVDMAIFENAGMVFNNRMPNVEIHQPLSVAECAVTVDCLRSARIVTFTEAIKKYIAACAADAELMYLPDPLSFAMPYLCTPMYYCNEHGGVEKDDLVDGQCDLCTGRYEDGELIDAPIPGLEGRGTNITRFSQYDYAPIAQKYEALALTDISSVQLNLTAVDIQVAKLLDINVYRKRKMSQLELQLGEVRTYV